MPRVEENKTRINATLRQPDSVFNVARLAVLLGWQWVSGAENRQGPGDRGTDGRENIRHVVLDMSDPYCRSAMRLSQAKADHRTSVRGGTRSQ